MLSRHTSTLLLITRRPHRCLPHIRATQTTLDGVACVLLDPDTRAPTNYDFIPHETNGRARPTGTLRRKFWPIQLSWTSSRTTTRWPSNKRISDTTVLFSDAVGASVTRAERVVAQCQYQHAFLARQPPFSWLTCFIAWLPLFFQEKIDRATRARNRAE